MHKFYRSVLLTGLVAVGLAGCGDEVTVVQPPPPPPPPAPTVKSISVAPNPGTVAIGGTITMSAAVVADEGVATTVTWSSSDASKATVNATSGVVTGVAAGSVAITATSTVAPTVSGNATVNVTAAPAAATISINSVTTAGGAPVLLAAVAGQINVALNLERGGESVQRVELLLGDEIVGSQVFAAAVSGEEDVQAAVEVINIPVNTASFNATTGVADHFNGPTTLTARVITAQNQQGSASPSLSLTLANANTVAATAEVTGGFPSATSAGGLLWHRGGLTVSVLPVIYVEGVTVTAGSATFGTPGCDASGVGQRTAALVAPAAGSFAWTATLANTGTPGAGNVANYELNAAGCPGALATGEGITVTAVGGGNPVLTGVGAGLALRLDNRAPGAPTFMANPNIRQNQWINAAVAMTGVNSGTNPNGWLVNGTADAGVGGYVRQIRVGDGPTAAAARAAAPTTTIPAPSLNNNSYCALASATDLLGNESALPSAGTTCTTGVVASSTPVAAQHLAFGVDIAAPTIAFSGGLASNAQLNGGTVGAEFQVTVADTGTIGNSGMLSGSAVRGTVQLRSAALTPPSAGSCFIGVFGSGACNATSINPAPPFPLVPTTTVAANTATAYYTYSAVAQDAAGNQSAPVTRVIAYDPAANVPALTSALYNTPLSGSTAVFNANASDNFDLQDVTYSLTYGGLLATFVYPPVVLNTFNTAPLVNSNVAAGITINGFMRQLEDVTGNAPLAVSGQYKPTQLDGVARDMALNSSATATTAIPGASVTTGVSYTAAAAAQLIDSWAITAPNAAINISNGAGPAAPANPLSVNIVVDAFGPTATFNPPFTRVDIYRAVGGNLVQIGTATFQGTFDNGAAQGRRHRWSFSWTPGASVAAGAQAIWAIGVNNNGDALISPVNGNITITNP
jgi:hypothetical protein